MTALRYGTGFTPVGEQAVVAETDKPCRQDMEQETVEEGMSVYGHLLQRISVPTVAIGEADLAIVDVD
jgi:hypothetical protein